MMRNLILVLLLTSTTFADTLLHGFYFLNPVVVTAHKYPTHIDNTSRFVTIITAEEIANSTATSVNDLLLKTVGVNVQQRGAGGVQADIQMRGASSEGVLILVDGAQMNDPQTSHHHFNLPVALQNIERIEILHGGASAVYGANAVGGVINIITKEMANNSSVNITGGENGLYELNGLLSYQGKRFSHQISAMQSHSDGFTDYTHFDAQNLFYKTAWQKNNNRITGWIGFTDKKFGANSFYSTAFPNEWEHTTTLSAAASGNFTRGRFNFSPNLSYRQHDDDFILDNSRPEWYRNLHTTNVYTLEMPFLWQSDYGDFFLAQNVRIEAINSNSLGDHQRTNYGTSLTWKKYFANRYNLALAQHLAYFEAWGWKSWQQLDFGIKLNAQHTVFASLNTSYRMPTFTEMYYDSPANLGNPNLSYEKFFNSEIGHRLTTDHILVNAALFYRNGENIIDWIRYAADEPWQVQNINAANTVGVEMDATFIMDGNFLQQVQLCYSNLHINKPQQDFESKYLFAYLRNHAGAEAAFHTPWHTHTSVAVHFYDRVWYNSYWLTDISIRKNFKDWTVALFAANLLNQTYEEISGVPMPGRWLRMSLSKSWNFDSRH